MSNQNNQKKLPSQTVLMIRGFIALYLMYMASDMLKTEDISNPRMIIIGSAVLFIVVGVILLISIIRCFIKGEYEGGKADISEEDTEEAEVIEEISEETAAEETVEEVSQENE